MIEGLLHFSYISTNVISIIIFHTETIPLPFCLDIIFFHQFVSLIFIVLDIKFKCNIAPSTTSSIKCT